MATATVPQTMGEYSQEVFKSDPKTALELVLAENERIRAEARADADVEFGPHGLQAKNMGGLWRLARIYAASDIVPDHYRRKPENCFIALQMAQRMGVDGLAFMQKSYIVHGRPAIETQLAIAVANTSGVFGSRIKYKISGTGDDHQCLAYVKDKETGEPIESIVSVKTAKDMGWWTKKDSLWPKMTDLMLQYRSALWLIRTNAPEVLMGVITKDEAADMEADEIAATSGNGRSAAPIGSLDALAEHLRTIGAEGNGQQENQPEAEGDSNSGDESPQEQSDAAPPTDPLDGFNDAMEAAGTISAVAEVESFYCSKLGITDDQSDFITKAADARRAAIRSSRGAGSNQQKQLA